MKYYKPSKTAEPAAPNTVWSILLTWSSWSVSALYTVIGRISRDNPAGEKMSYDQRAVPLIVMEDCLNVAAI